jgi:hypothetical protein
LAHYEDGFLRDARYLIHDRDPLFTEELAGVLSASCVSVVSRAKSQSERLRRAIRALDQD